MVTSGGSRRGGQRGRMWGLSIPAGSNAASHWVLAHIS